MLLDKPLESISESDLISLIENETTEGRDVDYKEFLGSTGDAKKELLADISSFANTSGGHLIIGIEEEKGIPTKLKGLEIGDIDAEKLRLDQIIQSGIRPRMVPSHQIQP